VKGLLIRESFGREGFRDWQSFEALMKLSGVNGVAGV
jgi:hypothetical protein